MTKYKGLKNILKQLSTDDGENNQETTEITGQESIETTDQETDNTESDITVSPEKIKKIYNEYPDNNGNIFGCYMDYTKEKQKYVLMIYKNPQGKEKIVCASIDMDDSTELIERVIDELGWDTNLVYVLGGGEITLENNNIQLDDNDEDQTFGILSQDNKALCQKILEQYLYGHGIERINHQTIKNIIDVFNIPLDDEAKAKSILILFQNIVAKYETGQRTPSLQEQRSHKQWRIAIKQYANDLETQLPLEHISDLEQYIEYTDNGRGIRINDYNGLKNTFMPYVIGILTLYPNIISHQK